MDYPALKAETDPKLDDALKVEDDNQNSEFNLANTHNQLERGLKSRHIQFLALGMFPIHSIGHDVQRP